jgi:aryl-alcohol dehydrogenase-like predicted oxidoreductase
MQQTFLGKTGIKVGRLALGTMTFGGDADREASESIYRRAREAGVDHLDTADVYNRGVTEEIVGGLIAGERDRIVLASKAYFPMSDAPNDRGTSRFHLVRAVEASLRRLKTDRIDLYYLHRFDDKTDLEVTLRAVEHLIASGKVLHVGISNFAAWQTAKALGVARALNLSPAVAIQPMYNLAKRQAEVELLPMALSEGLGVFPYSPLGGGLFSGKYGSKAAPEGSRISSWEIYKMRYGSETAFDLAERFNALAAEAGHHPAALAVAWVMSHPAVTAPILGARSVAQLDPVLGAADIVMTPELRDRISALTPEPPPATDRNEEGKSTALGSR